MIRELSTPPSAPVRWLILGHDGRRRLGRVVMARTWFEARVEAARLFGLPGDRVEARPWPVRTEEA